MSDVSESRGERLQLMLSPEELTLIDDFRFKYRMPSRAAAVRELMRRGLTVNGSGATTPGMKSSEFGVGTPAPAARAKR